MKVVAVNGSALKGGNTSMLIEAAFEPMREAGIECVAVELAGKTIGGCTACGACGREKDGQCHGRNDFGNELIGILADADGIILASPVYFADVSAEMKAAIDRVGYVSRANGNTFARKPGAAIATMRRAGAVHALDTMNHFFTIGEMVVVGSSYWNLGIGRNKGEVAEDTEGMTTMRRLGENFAWVLERLAG